MPEPRGYNGGDYVEEGAAAAAPVVDENAPPAPAAAAPATIPPLQQSLVLAEALEYLARHPGVDGEALDAAVTHAVRIREYPHATPLALYCALGGAQRDSLEGALQFATALGYSSTALDAFAAAQAAEQRGERESVGLQRAQCGCAACSPGAAAAGENDEDMPALAPVIVGPPFQMQVV